MTEHESLTLVVMTTAILGAILATMRRLTRHGHPPERKMAMRREAAVDDEAKHVRETVEQQWERIKAEMHRFPS